MRILNELSFSPRSVRLYACHSSCSGAEGGVMNNVLEGYSRVNELCRGVGGHHNLTTG